MYWTCMLKMQNAGGKKMKELRKMEECNTWKSKDLRVRHVDNCQNTLNASHYSDAKHSF